MTLMIVGLPIIFIIFQPFSIFSDLNYKAINPLGITAYQYLSLTCEFAVAFRKLSAIARHSVTQVILLPVCVMSDDLRV
jgi:hypothetical protein